MAAGVDAPGGIDRVQPDGGGGTAVEGGAGAVVAPVPGAAEELHRAYVGHGHFAGDGALGEGGILVIIIETALVDQGV